MQRSLDVTRAQQEKLVEDRAEIQREMEETKIAAFTAKQAAAVEHGAALARKDADLQRVKEVGRQ